MNKKRIVSIINTACWNLNIEDFMNDEEKLSIFRNMVADNIIQSEKCDDFNKIIPKDITEKIKKEINTPSKFNLRTDLVVKIIEILASELEKYDDYSVRQTLTQKNIKQKIDAISNILYQSTNLASNHSYFEIDGINSIMFRKIAETLEIKLGRTYEADKNLMYQNESKILLQELLELFEKATITVDKNVLDNNFILERIIGCLDITN